MVLVSRTLAHIPAHDPDPVLPFGTLAGHLHDLLSVVGGREADPHEEPAVAAADDGAVWEVGADGTLDGGAAARVGAGETVDDGVDFAGCEEVVD